MHDETPGFLQDLVKYLNSPVMKRIPGKWTTANTDVIDNAIQDVILEDSTMVRTPATEFDRRDIDVTEEKQIADFIQRTLGIKRTQRTHSQTPIILD